MLKVIDAYGGIDSPCIPFVNEMNDPLCDLSGVLTNCDP